MSEDIAWGKKPTEDIAWGVSPQNQQPQVQQEEVSWAEPKQSKNSVVDGLTGMLPSALLGAAKPFYGLNQAAWQLAGKVAPSVANYGDWPVEMLNKRQAQLNAEAGPTMSKFTTEPAALVGENILPTALANKANAALTAVPSVGKALLANMGIGSATAYANPEKTGLSQEEFAREKAKSTALGMAIPAAFTATGGLIKNTLSPTISGAAQKLADMGIDLTPGQKLGGALKNVEDKLTSYPFVGGMVEQGRAKGLESFNKAAFKRVLEPIGGQVPKTTGREGMQVVEDQVKNAYNELLPSLTFKATPTFNTNMAELRDLSKGLPGNLGQSFNENIDQIIAKRMSKNGSMDGIDFKKAESDLSRMAKNYLGSSTASERDLGGAFKQALINFRTALAESNPQKAAELNKTNEAFAKLSILRDAASKANTQDTFSPSQLATAVRSADKSAGKNKTATGNAMLQDLSDAGVSVLPNKIGNSGTADRMLGSSPLAWAIGLGSTVPYGAAKFAAMDRPEVMKRMANAVRGKSPYWAGPIVNKSLQEDQ